jgi:hypothetical protein
MEDNTTIAEDTDIEENLRVEGVATVHTVSKRIVGFSTWGSDSLADGEVDGDYTTIYVYDMDIPFDFLQNYYYDFDNEEFIKGPERPHQHVTWNPVSNDWDINEAPYLEEVTLQRTRLLYMTDWCFVGDVTLDPADELLVTEYRQELRDFPATVTDFDKPVAEQDWPEVPPFLISSSTTRTLFGDILPHKK